MKKQILILASLFIVGSAFADKSRFFNENGELYAGMYITSPEGLRVRDEPSLSGNRISGFAYGDYVLVSEIGEEVTIDGITDPWVKVYTHQYEWAEYEEIEYGWVFGGYLNKIPPKDINTSKVISLIKKSDKSYDAEYFPYDENTNYYHTDWRDPNNVSYNAVLKNYNLEGWGTTAVTVRECLAYRPAVAADIVGSLIVIPENTLIKIIGVDGFGIQNKVLFPIYYAEVPYEDYTIEVEIRGIDVTTKNFVYASKDAKGNKTPVFFQEIIKNITTAACGTTYDEITSSLNDQQFYDEAEYYGKLEKLNAQQILRGK